MSRYTHYNPFEDYMTEPYKRLWEAHHSIMAEEEAREERESIIREALERFRLEIVDNASPSIRELMKAIDEALKGR